MAQTGPFSDLSQWISTHWEAWRLPNLVHLGWILLLAFVLARLLRTLEARVVARVSPEGRATSLRRQQVQTLAGLLRSTGTVLIIAFAILTALPELGVSVAPLTVAAGLASVAVGFGAQNLVRDWISGALIVFEDQYVVGETVQIGDTIGRVEELTLRETVVRDAQGARVHIPNGEIRKLANLSRDYSQIFLDVQIPPAAAGERALAALDRVASELRADAAWSPALVDGPRVLGIEALAPSGATVRVQVRTVPLRQNEVARELRRRIVARFADEGVEFVSEQRVVLVNPTAVPLEAAAPAAPAPAATTDEQIGSAAAGAGSD
ncbi:MAG TPA: mechanosensitive ion channel family protein [Candidatus Acidoferrales bacterium]|nr:mechanosensitive ion channel family protein [Candidatus Acidoferrales bacterium]